MRVVSVPVCAALMFMLMAMMHHGRATAMEVGILKCRFNGVDAAVHFGSKRKLECVFKQKRRKRRDRYQGLIEKYGIEVGIIGSRQLVWRVTTRDGRKLRRGALAGRYRGVTAEASVGAGFAATLLTGGPSRSFSLHPLSFQKVEGLNVAAGLVVLTLTRKR